MKLHNMTATDDHVKCSCGWFMTTLNAVGSITEAYVHQSTNKPAIIRNKTSDASLNR